MPVARSNVVLNQRKKKNFLSVEARNRMPHRAGLNVRALIVLISTAAEIVKANWRKSCPVMPPMNAVGTKTARRTSVVAITGPVISFIAAMAASLEFRPRSR